MPCSFLVTRMAPSCQVISPAKPQPSGPRRWPLRIGQGSVKRAHRAVYIFRRTEISPLNLTVLAKDVDDVSRFAGRVMLDR